MFVRPRNDESLYAELFQFSAQFGHPPITVSCACRFGEGLKSTFKHRSLPISLRFLGAPLMKRATVSEATLARAYGSLPRREQRLRCGARRVGRSCPSADSLSTILSARKRRYDVLMCSERMRLALAFAQNHS